jgi:hypothetical protein
MPWMVQCRGLRVQSNLNENEYDIKEKEFKDYFYILELFRETAKTLKAKRIFPFPSVFLG